MAQIDGGILQQGLARAREMQQPAQPQAQPQGQQPAQQQQPVSQGGFEEGANVTPEEQQAYEAFMGNIAALLYDRAALPKIVESLKNGGPHPVSALAMTAATIIRRVQDSAEEAVGEKVDPDILLNAGKETTEALAEISEKAGIHEFSDDELESAYLGAVDIYRAGLQRDGKLTDTAPFEQDLMRLKSADQAGALEAEYPQIAEYGKHIQSQLQSGEGNNDK